MDFEKKFGSYVVKKIECTNHILRNYSVRLRDLSTKRKSASGLIVPGFIRTKIKENLLRLRFAVTKAITFRKNMDLPQNEKVKLLKIYILNGPFHVFGFHDKCDSYFCSKNKENEVNLVPELQKYGVWNDLIAAVNLVAYHINNNSVETYNSVVAKYVGGKRVNFSLRGSYNARCNTAVSAYNYGPNYLRQFYKKSTNFSPGIYTKKFIAKENKRRYTEKTNCKISSRYITEKCIYDSVLNEQRSSSTRYGIENESIARNAFQKTIKEKIEPAGLFIHKNKPYLAASPDGLIGKDCILEIKCPPSIKEYTPEEAIHKKKIKYMISEGFIVDKISKDVKFWTSKIEPFVTTFYMESLLPEIIDPRFDRGLPIRSGIPTKKL
ncbi:hypothetical protein QTP88_019096 [Uroleucon formosanum]